MTWASDDKEAASWLAAIVESSDDAIIAKDLTGVVVAWNDAAERLLGYTAPEMAGQTLMIIFPPDRLEEEAFILARIARGERVEHFETERRCKDGRTIAVSVTISPIRDAAGTIIGASKVLRDLTERNIRERHIQELQAELAHVQRLSELGQVVSALVHEVNQPITAIANYASACRRLAEAGHHEKLPEALARVVEQVQRAQRISARIRDFVKKGDARMQPENLADVIDEALILTVASLLTDALTPALDVEPAIVCIDKVQVQQVLFNLIRNGAEAMRGQERRVLRIAAHPAQDGCVEVSVSDTGTGIAPDVRNRLFQPFVTTKPEGMGIGLSICRTIVESHGGQLWADDNPGGGTIFRFTLAAANFRPPLTGAG